MSITARELAAMLAMQGILSSPLAGTKEQIAVLSVECADLLIKELENVRKEDIKKTDV